MDGESGDDEADEVTCERGEETDEDGSGMFNGSLKSLNPNAPNTN